MAGLLVAGSIISRFNTQTMMTNYPRIIVLVCLISAGLTPVHAQELFVYSEPASNMPAHSLGLRATNLIMGDREQGGINYHFLPEIMWGVNQNLMLHAEGFISNRNGGMDAEGVGFYAKYRFFTKDTMYRHFRAAAFGRATTNNTAVHQEQIMTNAHNSGIEAGLIATQLLHREAYSATLSYERAMNNFGGNEYPAAQPKNALNLTLSFGHLFFPKHYNSYKQVNMNGMIELPCQQLFGSDKRYIDIAPSVQFIFNSQLRVDIGYRQELYSNMIRTAPNGLLLRAEYLLFNAVP